MPDIDPCAFAEVDYLYFEPDTGSQGIVRAFARGPLWEVLAKARAEPPQVRAHLYVTIGDPSWRLIDGRRVEALRPQIWLEDVRHQW